MSHKSSNEIESKGKTVEAIVSGMSSSVTVAIEITNLSTYTLEKPSYVMQHGVMEYPPHTEVKPGEKRACGFRKYGAGAAGCLGVLRYAVKNTDKCLDIFFSSPYVCMFYDRTHAIQLEHVGNNYTAASQRLLEEIDHSIISSTDFDKNKAGDTMVTVTNKVLDLTVTAHMQNESKSVMRVHLSAAKD